MTGSVYLMTTGSMMFYGGIAGAVVLGIIALILIPVTSRKRKKMLDRILRDDGR
ncbi:MAG: hypothetical protein IJP92_09820 [Lachnospiraceae bacterium]|nr:hypothetical protein [Lachnospiraceae bacterium]